ncbi:bifunctional phosphoribosyl-AMP cyclohydrolase/phosphoribosyl-ATP diphosphatase HisIE [Peloplasma aerotolerans]|uniref:Histidine biosynthesis bifunctional protein HisIE n=1 Tax=Peloplasma aerotolerans TaxID=3044389 RepID=A0AAW6UA89_9MOLU|nr:bifunctional phosphoribosyl-AMP cyclohydrolase/phosphoribosyl-ATP diphosphatase HisIE [Mariniplasma sp. M4Ah]MDI6453629.1 bifunctional phosphoribosyl-AMP cyclohydrolase/phosphoribosyl-ATP diphosphatase HisIE [Mariniplasma sp. M4Ah]
MKKTFDISKVKYNQDGLIPVIVQSVLSKEVLMLAYMNPEALGKTIDTKEAYYYSRSRNTLWKKGETSGHIQYVKSLAYDCDQDTLLIQVDQIGVACHTGEMSCFYTELFNDANNQSSNVNILNDIFELIQLRKNEPIEGSYTTYLFNKGLDKILKKVGEETAEIIIGAKNQSKDETVYEISDLVYHILVLMVNQGITPKDIEKELCTRRK